MIKHLIKKYKEKKRIMQECEIESFLDDFQRTTGITYKTKKQIKNEQRIFDECMKLKHGFTVYK